MDQCWTLYSNQWRTGLPVGDRSLLDAAVANFNATVERLGPVVSVSHWSDQGREWEFECWGSRQDRQTIMASMAALGDAMAAFPGWCVRLDRNTSRLFIV